MADRVAERLRSVGPALGLLPGRTSVSVEGGGGRDEVVVRFSPVDRPACIYGIRLAAWDAADVTGAEWSIETWGDVLVANVMERLEAVGYGLPDDCEDEGVTWLAW